MLQQCHRDRVSIVSYISQNVDRILYVFWLVFYLKYAYPYDAQSSFTLNIYPHALAAAPWREKAGHPICFSFKVST